MTNFDLHNKMLQIAKAVHELEQQHPELAPDLVRLHSILAASGEVEPSHPTGQSLYRNSG